MRCIEVVHCQCKVSRKLNMRYSWGCLGFDRQKRLHFEIFIFAKNPKFDMPIHSYMPATSYVPVPDYQEILSPKYAQIHLLPLTQEIAFRHRSE